MQTRKDLLSEIFRYMTGAEPPNDFWETPTGRGIINNDPTLLYQHPTSNLYDIIKETGLSIAGIMYSIAGTRTRDGALSTIIPKAKALNWGDDEIMQFAIPYSALKVAKQTREAEQKRFSHRPLYRKPSNPILKKGYRKKLLECEAERKRDALFLRSVRRDDMYKRKLRGLLELKGGIRHDD